MSATPAARAAFVAAAAAAAGCLAGSLRFVAVGEGFVVGVEVEVYSARADRAGYPRNWAAGNLTFPGQGWLLPRLEESLPSLFASFTT